MKKMSKEDLITQINSDYSPRPIEIDLWLDEDDELYKALIKQDDSVYFSQYDPFDGECYSESFINESIVKRMEEFMKK